jgi:hypothetical protein
MTDFRDLDPETRCFALVGQFLQAWSVMEGSLHNVIGAALNIETTKLYILSANIRFRDKTNIISSLIDVAPNFTKDEKATLRKNFRDLAEYSANRNMVAHDAFGPDASKTGVEFLTVKAKGKFALPNVVWSADQFRTERATIDQYRTLLESLVKRFRSRPLGQQNYSAALQSFLREGQGGLVPMTRSPLLTFSDFRILPTPALLDNDQATPKANPQRRDKPQE